ncbi:MAG: helix-turn-helix transcriptional regulator [Alphaproteobacteria bacterium]|nr:helix-turn-helix transcriptional regulator [Alphaproteobacteria bacterium]
MLTHDQLWRALDRYADYHGLTTSGLARRAGLDPTSFNPSKRITREGKLRWPSSESIAKVLDATGGTMIEFVSFLQDLPGAVLSQDIPFLSIDEASDMMRQRGEEYLFDDHGAPARDNWDSVVYPDVNDSEVYALEVTDDSLEPVYRSGTVIVMSPGASIRRRDRVLICMNNHDLIIRELIRQTAHRIDIAPVFAPDESETIMSNEVLWISRIVWASQ